MTQPTAYVPQTDFSNDEASNVGGRSTVRTANLDAEFAALQVTTDGCRTSLALLQRDDGALHDGIVTLASLAAATDAFLALTGATPRGQWLTATAYALKDVVVQTVSASLNTYMCAVAHTSGVFATDLTAVKWLLISNGAATGTFPTVPLSGITDLTTTGNTILGDATTDTLNVGANGIVKDASGNVGLGTNAPIDALTLALPTGGKGIAFGVVSNNYANFWAPFSTGGLAMATGLSPNVAADAYASSYGGGAIARAAIRMDILGTTGIRFYSDLAAVVVRGTAITPTLRMQIATDGTITPGANNAQTLGSAGLRWSTVNSVFGNFSGLSTHSVGLNTGNAAQAAVTTLDWYEEGTWVPTATGIGAPTYTTQVGEFQRIGNKVKFRITLAWTGGTNGAGIASVTGLPYASTAQIHPCLLLLNLLNASFTWAGTPMAYANGGTTLQLAIQATAATLLSLVNPSAGTKDLYIAGEYFV